MSAIRLARGYTQRDIIIKFSGNYHGHVDSLLVAAGSADNDDLATRLMVLCRESLAGIKVPRSIEFRESLPRTGTGKLQKRLLREPFWSGYDRRI